MSYSKQLDKILAYSFDRHWWPRQTSLMKRGLYLVCLTACVYYLWDSSALFGKDSYVIRQPRLFSGLHDLPYLLYSHPATAFYFLLTGTVIALAGLKGWRSIPSDFLLWFIFINLHYAIYPGITGGQYLLNQLLFFQCLLSFPQKQWPLRYQSLQHFLNNAGAISIMTQVCMIYLVSGVAKLSDSSWWNGEAVSMVGRLRHFRLYDTILFNSPGVATVLTYLILIYQLSFPVLIWWTPLRKIASAVAVPVYLYIALYMGLMSFGMIMLLAHLYFWPMKAQES
jgi:hypothetical protein